MIKAKIDATINIYMSASQHGSDAFLFLLGLSAILWGIERIVRAREGK